MNVALRKCNRHPGCFECVVNRDVHCMQHLPPVVDAVDIYPQFKVETAFAESLEDRIRRGFAKAGSADGWLPKFCGKHRSHVADAMRAPAESMAEIMAGHVAIPLADQVVESFADGYATGLLGFWCDNPTGEQVDEWNAERPGAVAVELTEAIAQAIQGGNDD